MHPFPNPGKHQKTVRFSDVFRRQRKGAMGANGLTVHIIYIIYQLLRLAGP